MEERKKLSKDEKIAIVTAIGLTVIAGAFALYFNKDKLRELFGKRKGLLGTSGANDVNVVPQAIKQASEQKSKEPTNVLEFVHEYFRRLPNGESRSPEKDAAIKAMNAYVPENYTFVNAYERRKTQGATKAA